MRDYTRYIGLDYHDDQIQACVLDAAGQVLANRRCPNDWQALAAMVEPGVSVQAALEAGSGTADLAQQLTEKAGWSVSLAHSRYVAKLKQSPDKTDVSDAHLLGDLTRVGYLPRSWQPPQYIRELRKLVRYRQQLADQRRAMKLRIQSIRREHRLHEQPANAWTKAWIDWLAHHPDLPEASRWLIHELLEEIDHVNGKIRRVHDRMRAWTANDAAVEKLLNLPGVGEVTAWGLLAAVGRFDRFKSGKALARYCGLSPRNASSGQKQREGGLIGEADPKLRALLIQAGHRLANTPHSRWGPLAGRLRQQGKAQSVVVAAVTNRWLRWVYHQMVCETEL